MTGTLPPAPASLFDHPLSKPGAFPFDIDVTGATRLYLIVQDTGSYSPEKVEAVWNLDNSALPVKTPSQLVYDISGKGLTRLRGFVNIENTEVTSDINPQIRFLIFKDQPDPERLTPVASEAPLPALPVLHTPSEAVDRVFRYALGRPPSPAERHASLEAITGPAGTISPEGLADLLWAVLVKPEFQLIY